MRFCLWITGLPGSGKSTIAVQAEKNLKTAGIDILTLNLDRIRKVLTPNPKYTEEERDIVYRSLVYMAKLLFDECYKNIIIDATGNYIKYRNLAREMIPEFAEVYIKCPLEVSIERESVRNSEDVKKGLYQKAASGQLRGGMPGITAPYEENENPELIIDSYQLNPPESAKKIADYIRSRWM